MPNALSVALGPPVFGLPYRHARLSYNHTLKNGAVSGQVVDTRSGKRFAYTAHAEQAAAHAPCAAGSLDEFLVERYTAFTSVGPRRLFRIWHPPWPVTRLEVDIHEHGLLPLTGHWSHEARLVSAHHSPGIADVWMGRPHFVGG